MFLFDNLASFYLLQNNRVCDQSINALFFPISYLVHDKLTKYLGLFSIFLFFVCPHKKFTLEPILTTAPVDPGGAFWPAFALFPPRLLLLTAFWRRGGGVMHTRAYSCMHTLGKYLPALTADAVAMSLWLWLTGCFSETLFHFDFV